MEAFDLTLLAGLVLGFGLISKRIERTIITPPIVAVLAGLLLGPPILGWLGIGLGEGPVWWSTPCVDMRPRQLGIDAFRTSPVAAFAAAAWRVQIGPPPIDRSGGSRVSQVCGTLFDSQGARALGLQVDEARRCRL